MPNDAAAEKPGSAEYRNGSFIRRRHGSNSRLPAFVQDLNDLVEMRVDLVGQLIQVIPLPAELRRSMGRPQLIATLPLDVVDDAASVEAAMQADGDEPGLFGHEASPLGYQGQCLRLLSR